MAERIKHPGAVALGKLGGAKTAKRGSKYYAEIQAKRVRRNGRPKNPAKSAYEGELKIGNVKILCVVLDDKTRLIVWPSDLPELNVRSSPIEFVTLSGNRVQGYPSEVLP